MTEWRREPSIAVVVVVVVVACDAVLRLASSELTTRDAREDPSDAMLVTGLSGAGGSGLASVIAAELRAADGYDAFDARRRSGGMEMGEREECCRAVENRGIVGSTRFIRG
jgi:hypothetical protein